MDGFRKSHRGKRMCAYPSVSSLPPRSHWTSLLFLQQILSTDSGDVKLHMSLIIKHFTTCLSLVFMELCDPNFERFLNNINSETGRMWKLYVICPDFVDGENFTVFIYHVWLGVCPTDYNIIIMSHLRGWYWWFLPWMCVTWVRKERFLWWWLSGGVETVEHPCEHVSGCVKDLICLLLL